MKRMIIYTILIVLVVCAPVRRVDVEQMMPVELVALRRENNMLVIETDTQDTGCGITVQSALQDLKQNAYGVIYLDTAQYLLYTEEVKAEAEQLRGLLRGSIQAYLYDGNMDLTGAVRYLKVHGKISLKNVK